MKETDRTVQAFRIDRRSTLYLAALSALPLLLLAVNRSWVYTTVGWVDPWIYEGYDLHPQALLRDFPSVYYGTRVPWTAFGWAVHRFAGDELSLYIIALTLVYASVFATFYFVHALFHNRDAAFICACLVATNSWLLWAFGFGYIDGPTIACMFIAFAALAGTVASRRWRTAAVLCGAATAAFVIITIPYVVFVPISFGILLLLNVLCLKRPVFIIALYWGSGCLGFGLLTCLVSWLLGGNFFFFAPEIAAALPILGRQVVERTNEYWAPWRTWFWSAPWLLFPAFGTIASAALLALRGPIILRGLDIDLVDPATRLELRFFVVAAAQICATGVFALMQGAHLSMLLYYYRANALLPFTFLVFGACLAVGLSRTSRRLSLSLSFLAPIVCLAPWALGLLGLLQVDFRYHGASPTATGANLFVGILPETLWMAAGAATLVTLFISRQWPFAIGAVLFMTVVSIGTIAPGSDTRIPDNPRFRNEAMTVFDGANAIDGSSLNAPAFFWWDKADPERSIFRSLSAMYNWNSYFPPPPALGDRVIALYSNSTFLVDEERRLSRQHLLLGSTTLHHIQRGSIGFDLAIGDVSLDLSGLHQVSIPLSTLRPLQRDVAGVGDIVTPSQPWAYAATIDIAPALKLRFHSVVYLRIRMNVRRGDIGAGVTTADGQAWVDRVFVRATLTKKDIYLTIPSLSSVAQIVFCNGENSASSVGSVSSIDLLYREGRPRRAR